MHAFAAVHLRGAFAARQLALASKRAAAASRPAWQSRHFLSTTTAALPVAATATATRQKRVCVIGAGPGGLSVLSAFQRAAAAAGRREGEAGPTNADAAGPAGAEIPEVVCYDAQPGLGGLWNFSSHTLATDKTEHKEHSRHAVMYRHLWTNAPKETIEYVDYPFDRHFGGQIPSYTSSGVMLDYLKGRAAAGNLQRWIRFRTQVAGCRYDAETGRFEVKVRDLDAPGAELQTESFDWVIGCAGKYAVPNEPDEVPGMRALREQGKVMHSKDFRNPEEFAGKDVLLIGASYSAEDIASLLCKFGARSATISWRTDPPGSAWPKETRDFIRVVPSLPKSFKGQTAFFENGEHVDVDAVIMCTGYKKKEVYAAFMEEPLRPLSSTATLPSLTEECSAAESQADVDEALDDPSSFDGTYAGIRGLYNGIVSIDRPKLLFVGFASTWSSWSLMEAQARYAAGVILGKVGLPDYGRMRTENAERRKEERAVQEAVDNKDKRLISLETAYVKYLLNLSSTIPSRDVICPDRVKETLLHWKGTKIANIMTYRDNSYPSLVTGKMAAAPKAPWLQEKDDSVERFAAQTEDSHRQQPRDQQADAATISEFLINWKRRTIVDQKIRSFRGKLQSLAEAAAGAVPTTSAHHHPLPEPNTLVWQQNLSPPVARLRG